MGVTKSRTLILRLPIHPYPFISQGKVHETEEDLRPRHDTLASLRVPCQVGQYEADLLSYHRVPAAHEVYQPVHHVQVYQEYGVLRYLSLRNLKCNEVMISGNVPFILFILL